MDLGMAPDQFNFVIPEMRLHVNFHSFLPPEVRSLGVGTFFYSN